MNGGGERVQALNESGRRSVEKFVANAVDAPVPDRRQVLPSTSSDNFLQWDPIAGPAPGGDEHVWGSVRDVLG